MLRRLCQIAAAPRGHRTQCSVAPVISTTLAVQPMGTLRLATDLPTTLEIATENQECDTVHLELHEASPDGGLLEAQPDGKGGVTVSVTGGGRVTAMIPEKFSVSLQSAGGSVQLGRLEGDAAVNSAGGAITTDKLSEGVSHMQSGGGAVNLRVINSSQCVVDTAGGGFEAFRVQAPSFELETAGGKVDIRAAYVGSAKVVSGGGDVTIGSLHGDQAEISTAEGDLKIESGLDGDLTANCTSGGIAVHLGDGAKSVRLESLAGDISLTAPTALVAEPVELYAGIAVEVDPVFEPEFKYDGKTFTGTINPKEREPLPGASDGYRAGILANHMSAITQLHARAPAGRVSLQGRGWLDSILSKHKKK